MILRKQINDTILIKSGTNFREFHRIDIVFDKTNKKSINENQVSQIFETNKFISYITKIEVTSKFSPNPIIKEHVNQYTKNYLKEKEKVLTNNNK